MRMQELEFWQTWESELERVLVSPQRARAARRYRKSSKTGTASDKKYIHLRDEA